MRPVSWRPACPVPARKKLLLFFLLRLGLGIIASGLSWHKGENVITADGDFPANIYPWLNLKSQGVEVRVYPPVP